MVFFIAGGVTLSGCTLLQFHFTLNKFTQLIKKSKIDIVVCNSKNDIKLENIDIPIYCLDESIVLNKGKTIKLS